MIAPARRAFRERPGTGLLWAINLAAIPAVSYFGRPLQRFLADNVGRPGIAWMLAAGVAFLLIFSGYILVRKSGLPGLGHLAWMILLVGGLMLYLRQNPERWLHIPLFGMFGFLSVRLFSIRAGAEIAFALAVLDEVFQHFLSDRVGDIEDMVINALCAAAGISLCLVLRARPGHLC